MPDVSPAPAAPPSAPPPAAPVNEVVVDTNPVSSPTPIGSQAPSKPVGDLEGSKHRPESRREAIANAFKRVGIGHNQPPGEALPVERAAPKAAKAKDAGPDEKIDLRKPPERERGEGGRFTAKARPEGEGAQNAPAATAESRRAAPGEPPRQVAPLPEGAPWREAPARMDPRAKAEWAAAPESVRGAVIRMHNEFGRAYQQFRGDHESMNQIRHFDQLAQSQGTTLARAIGNYKGMEDKLRGDPIGGLETIVNNLNLRTSEGQRITLRDLAWHYLNQTPDQHKAIQLQNSQTAISHQMGQLHAQQQAIAQNLQHMQYQQRYAHTRGQVDRFAETHPRLDELGDLIERELKLGFDLNTAYWRANLLRPSHAAQTRTAPAQTRTTDRSISGAPDGGSSRGAARRGPPPSRRDAIASAIKRVNGSL